MKKITQYIPLQLAFFLTLGILLESLISIPKLWLFTGIGISFFLLFLSFLYTHIALKPNRIFQLLSYVVILQMGYFTATSHNPEFQKNHYSHFVQTNNNLIFQIEKSLKSTKYNWKYYAKVLQVDSIDTKGTILVIISKDSLQKHLEIGTVYYSKTDLQLPNKPLNPYTFNYKKYLNNNGITHQIQLTSKQVKKINYSPNYSSMIIIAGKWRQYIQERLAHYTFDKDALGIINALILGQRQNISKELLNSYAGAGAIHILAVSGLHVGILLLILNFLLKPLEKIYYGITIKTILIIALLFSFALLTGLSGSVVRAVTMFSFIAIGMQLKNRENSIFYALITSYLFLLLIKPFYLYDVGFQMSYTAVLGILVIQPKLMPNIQWWLPKKILELLSVSIAATLGTLPLSLYYFHQFPALFFLSNLVIIPVLGLIMSFGLLVVFLAVIDTLPEFIVIIYNHILNTLNLFIQWVASKEDFVLRNIHFSWEMLLISYLIIILGILWLHYKKPVYAIFFLSGIFLFQSNLFYEKYKQETTNRFVFFHQTKETVIGLKNGNTIQFLCSNHEIKKKSYIQTYLVAKHAKATFTDSIPAIIKYGNDTILIVDSLGIYKPITFHPTIVLLRQSPKINLERLINILKPKEIIADGSNYKSYIKHWEKTCNKQQIKYHYTGNKGAFLME